MTRTAQLSHNIATAPSWAEGPTATLDGVVTTLLRPPIDLRDGHVPVDSRAERLRVSTAVAIAVIALLNLADIITTRAVLAHSGAVESNPLASSLLSGGRVGLIKAAVLLVLILRVPRRTPTIAYNAVMWFVAGFYFLTVISNVLVLQRVS